MKENTTGITHKHTVLKALATLFSVLLISAVVTLTAFAEEVDVNSLVEIVSVEYTESLVEGMSGSYLGVDGSQIGRSGAGFVVKTEEPVEVPRYYIKEEKLQLMLRFADGTVKECTGKEAMQLFGWYNVSISAAQSYTNYWKAGPHICYVTIGSQTKEFTVTIEPNPAGNVAEIVSVD